jgi:hypothetical protein
MTRERRLRGSGSAFAVLEELYLPQSLLSFFFGFVRTTKILLAVLGKNFVTTHHFFYHGPPRKFDAERMEVDAGP